MDDKVDIDEMIADIREDASQDVRNDAVPLHDDDPQPKEEDDEVEEGS
jgi:hypothetical protein